MKDLLAGAVSERELMAVCDRAVCINTLERSYIALTRKKIKKIIKNLKKSQKISMDLNRPELTPRQGSRGLTRELLKIKGVQVRGDL